MEKIITDEVQIDYYKLLENNLSFWLDDQDDDIFRVLEKINVPKFY